MSTSNSLYWNYAVILFLVHNMQNLKHIKLRTAIITSLKYFKTLLKGAFIS